MDSTESVLEVQIHADEVDQLLDLPCSSQKDKHVSNEKEGKKKNKKKPRLEAVTIPISDWNNMKKQNERILALLGQGQGQTEGESPDDHGSKMTQRQKRKAESQESGDESDSFEDYDDQIESMIRVNEGETCGQTCGTSNSDTEMAEIEQEFDNAEKLAPEIPEGIAKLVDETMAKGQISEEKMKEKMNKYARPKNLKVVVPKVNPEIWSILDRATRGADLKLQQYQKALCTATYALTNIWQTILKSESPEIRGLMKGVADSIALVQKTNHDLSIDRRGKISNAQLNKKYKKLGSAEVPITDMLFGNDLKAACANIDTTARMGLGLSQSSGVKGQKFFPQNNPFAKNDWNWRPRGAGRTWTPRGRMRGRGPYRARGRMNYRGSGRTEWQQGQQ